MVSNTVFEGASSTGGKKLYAPVRMDSKEVDAEYGSYGQSRELEETPKLYRKRFLMLFLFSMCTMLNGFQWIQFSIISTIASCYYNVSITTVNWTSTVYMGIYPFLIFPAMWLMNSKGLRLTLIIACAGQCLCACAQGFTLPSDKFSVVLFSQTVGAIAQTFSLSVPPLIAAVWFGAGEVSFACAMAVFSNQLGVAIGFVVPPNIVPSDCDNKNGIKDGLSYLALGQMVFSFALFVLTVIFFRDKPPTPPSFAESSKPVEQESLLNSVKILFRNRDYCLVLLCYGLLASVIFSVGTLLNQMVVTAFPGEEVNAGWIGMLSILTGMVGSLSYGYVLDRTQQFRRTSLFLCFMSLFTVVIFTIVAHIKHLWLYFVMYGTMGLFLTGCVPVGYELGAEITYPISEGTSATIFAGVYQVLCRSYAI